MASPLPMFIVIFSMLSVIIVWDCYVIQYGTSMPFNFIELTLAWLRETFGHDLNVGAFAVFFCVVSTMVTFWISLWGSAARPEGLDNGLPRDQKMKLEGVYKRAYHCHQNCIESVAIIGAAVTLSLMTGAVPTAQFEAAIVIYLVARIKFIAFFLLDWQTLRSAAYMAAMMACVIILAWNAFPTATAAFVQQKADLLAGVLAMIG